MMENAKQGKRIGKTVLSRIASVLMALALLLIMQGISGIGFEAKADVPDLPFKLEAPSRVALAWMKGRDAATAMNLTYSMGNEMSNFFSQSETDPEGWPAKINALGYDSISMKAQMDWSLDSNSDWKYTADWDNYGVNDAGVRTVGPWDAVDETATARIVDYAWVFRGVRISDDNVEWTGDGTAKGLKEQLKDGQYTIKKDSEGTDYLYIDYSQHTMYVRVRYIVTARALDDTEKNFISDWSSTTCAGKDTTMRMAVLSLEAPSVSDPRISGEGFNGAPVAQVTQTVSDGVKNLYTDVLADNGTMRFYAEARVKGTDKWIQCDGTGEIWNGAMDVKLIYLQIPGKEIPAGTEIELRFRYYYEMRNGYDGDTTIQDYSAYTPVYTVKLTQPIPKGPGDPVDDGSGSGDDTDGPAIATLDGKTPATEGQVEAFVKSLKNDNDPKGTTFGFLFAKQKKATKNAITITWKKPKNAAYFVIYGNKCGKENHYERITSVTATSYTHKGLEKGTYYKFLVSAFDKDNKHLGTSNTVHVATKGGKVCNFKKVTTVAKKNQVTLAKKGKTFKLKGKATPESTKLKVNVHRKVRYESTDKKIATVSTSGKVTAKKKGTCYIYVYAQNGAYQKVKVTVKK